MQLPKYGRYYHSHVVYRGMVFLLGGFSMKGPTNEVSRIAHPRQQGWQSTFRMERARGFFQAQVFQDRIWACGGKNQTQFMRDCESYSPEDGWRAEPMMMEDRFDHASAVTKAGLYIFGSKPGMRKVGSSGQTAYSVEFYPAAAPASGGSFDPRWQPGPQLPEPIYGASAMTYMDNIYLFGGLHVTSRSERRKDVLVLKPNTEEWLVLGEMQYPRSRAVIVNFGYQMFLTGGCDKGCPAEQFTPSLGHSQSFSQYIKIDGSFSEAGVEWPWSCSRELCKKVYTEKQIEILTQVDYTTTLPTMPTSLFLMDQTTEVPELAMETTPLSGRSFIETTPPSDFLYFETTESWDQGLSTIADSYFMTTKPDLGNLYEMLMTTPMPTIQLPIEITEPAFVEIINKTRISLTTKSPQLEDVKRVKDCDGPKMSLLCNMLGRQSPFEEKELDHVKQPPAAVPPPLRPLLSTQSPKVLDTLPPESVEEDQGDLPVTDELQVTQPVLTTAQVTTPSTTTSRSTTRLSQTVNTSETTLGQSSTSTVSTNTTLPASQSSSSSSTTTQHPKTSPKQLRSTQKQQSGNSSTAVTISSLILLAFL